MPDGSEAFIRLADSQNTSSVCHAGAIKVLISSHKTKSIEVIFTASDTAGEITAYVGPKEEKFIGCRFVDGEPITFEIIRTQYL